KNLSMNESEAEYFKNEIGLLAEGKEYAATLESVRATAAALADEISRHFHYWDTRRNERGERMTPVGKVVLIGGSSNLRGLADFISGKVQAPVERGNIWQNICDFEEYIPPIDRRASLEYATTAGLALRGY
ncbi:MAG: Type pilus assembly protein PilM, partial [Candidatus Parcubacteria bacterium]